MLQKAVRLFLTHSPVFAFISHGVNISRAKYDVMLAALDAPPLLM